MNKNLHTSLKAVTSGVKNGTLVPGSEEELQVSIFELEQKQEQVRQVKNTSFIILKELTGKDLIESEVLTVPQINLENEINRPELKLFAMQKQSIAELGNVSKSKRMPKLGAFAQLGYGNPGLNMLKDEWTDFYIVGARLQWNIYDWGNSKRERQEYIVQQKQIDNQQEVFLRGVNISKTREEMKQLELQTAIEKDTKIINLHEKIRKRSESQLINGVITTSDYIKKLTAETNSKIQKEIHLLELIRSKVNYNTMNGNTSQVN